MSRSPRQDRDGWEEIRWRLTSLPTRLRGEEPGTSPAEALEDLLLLGVVGALAMIVALFLYTTVNPSPSHGQATTWAASPTTTGTGSEGTANLKSVPRGRTGSNVGGGGGGGGGGGAGSNGSIGSLSERYETGGRGPGTVSSGKGDPGGASYGLYQFTSKPNGGNVAKFLASDGSQFASEFQGMTPGSAEFTAKWKEIVTRDPGAMRDAQHAYTERTHYEPLREKLNNTLGLDVNDRSAVLRDVVWSTSVQHGPKNNVINNAVGGRDVSQMSDRELISAIYTERGRTNSNGQLVYFTKVGANQVQGLKDRFRNESADALGRLEN